MNIAKGYLSYTLALLAILGGIAGWYMGTVDQGTALTMIWGGLAMFGLRRAIA